MVGVGMVMLLLALYGLYLSLTHKYEQQPLYLRLLPWAIILPYIGNSTGWLFTEIARQPWIVFGLQKTADAVSPNVTVGMVLTSLIAFTLIYGVLMVADIYLLAKYARLGPGEANQTGPADAPAGVPVGAYLK